MIINIDTKGKGKKMSELEGVLIMSIVLVFVMIHLYMMDRAFTRIKNLEYQQKRQEQLNDKLSKG